MQMSKFLGISGTGWLIDFLIYLLLTIKLNLDVGYSNFISGIPALTFVFLVSTRKIFEYKSDGHSLKMKYSIYFLYQMILIVIISLFGKVLYSIINVSSFYNIVIIKNIRKL
ncbi:putative flippase GtrA [Clostridium beijerinckii]|uniref:GtrA family protein n=2 Tax=Clostridium beijerinckii TaxID=1520 RepID=UPI00156D5E08|nr:GtrA family protein [Clostridium beijerinckii]NRV15039.1 putative flippase GtrA [Clostridium beijerinckii]NRV67524.1 putative flippase GtrA [Clostridium beijerinckii]NRW87163.1 putative flippase GtrA [Clostridium beijerinckii]NRX84836.1 putative flippase GtrA [Clostridium beijerinckii]NRZ52097.1 putative flippase GtrA [Clostridium beijerinckii]